MKQSCVRHVKRPTSNSLFKNDSFLNNKLDAKLLIANSEYTHHWYINRKGGKDFSPPSPKFQEI